MTEALQMLAASGHAVDAMRVRGFPFADEIMHFIAEHETVFIVEQNRDGQLRTLVMNEGGVDPAKLIACLHYDGTPITARFIAGAIADHLGVAIKGLSSPTSSSVTEAAE